MDGFRQALEQVARLPGGEVYRGGEARSTSVRENRERHRHRRSRPDGVDVELRHVRVGELEIERVEGAGHLDVSSAFAKERKTGPYLRRRERSIVDRRGSEIREVRHVFEKQRRIAPVFRGVAIGPAIDDVCRARSRRKSRVIAGDQLARHVAAVRRPEQIAPLDDERHFAIQEIGFSSPDRSPRRQR